MTSHFFGYFLLGVVFYQVLKGAWLILNHELRRRRDTRILKMVQVMFPDHTKLTFVTESSSDKRAYEQIKKELQKYYDVSDEDFQ